MADVNDLIAQGGNNGMKTLADIQNYQNSAINLQRNRISLQNEQATQQATQAQAIAQSQTTQEETKQKKIETFNKQLQAGANNFLVHFPKGNIQGAIESAAKTFDNFGFTPEQKASALAELSKDAPIDNPDLVTRQAWMVNTLGKALNPSQQSANMAPAAIPTNTGAEIQQQQGGNLLQTGVKAGTNIGTNTKMQVAPQLVTNPQGGISVFIGNRVNGVGYGGQGDGNAAPQGLRPSGVTLPQPESPAMPLKYKPQLAGQARPLLPSEVADSAKGQEYRQSLSSAANGLAQSYRNLDEVEKQVSEIENNHTFTSGLLGAATRKISGALGSTEYTQLSKDLANIQISNLKAQGGSMDTDAGKRLQSMANGDETYPPDVLKNIIARTRADTKNTEFQSIAANKFADKFGDANVNTTFKQLWSKNADSKVFQAISIIDNTNDPSAKKEALDNLFGNDPKHKQELLQKYRNIKQLVTNGSIQ
jgi:hypothetical protein